MAPILMKGLTAKGASERGMCVFVRRGLADCVRKMKCVQHCGCALLYQARLCVVVCVGARSSSCKDVEIRSRFHSTTWVCGRAVT